MESYFTALTRRTCAGISNHSVAGIASTARQFVAVSLSTFIFFALSLQRSHVRFGNLAEGFVFITVFLNCVLHYVSGLS